MPLPTVESTPATLPIVEPYQRPAITPRGVAVLRLAEFTDAWAELTAEDRAYFAHWLTELLVDACLEAPAPTA